jgi:SAM-dependent methyltransferase
MNENPSASEWAAERGEKWRDQLAGMEGMIRPVDEPLIDALRLDAPYRIADIGCGGGGLTLEVLKRAPAGSVVHGFDISPALIETARRRGRAIVFDVADMATAAPPGAPYDRLVSRFGIMFFDDAPAAFANLFRWLARGGRFAFAAWGLPRENPWMMNVRDAVAEVVEVPKPDHDAPGPFRYGIPDALLTVLEKSGFGDIEVRDWRGQLPMGGGLAASDAASFALASFSSFNELLLAAGDQAVANARESLTERFSSHQQDGVVRMGASVHIVTGTRRRFSGSSSDHRANPLVGDIAF